MTNFSTIRMRLQVVFDSLGVDPESLAKFDKLKLSTSQTFLLIRLVGNLKGSQVDFLTFVFFPFDTFIAL